MPLKVKEKWMWKSLSYGLYSPWNSLSQNTGVGSLSLLQGILPNQGSSPCVPHHRRILYQLSYKGSPRTLEWVAYPFSRRSSWPRNQTRVSCILGRFLTNWAIRETLIIMLFNRSDVLNAFSTYNIFNLTIGLLGHNPILSQGKSLSLCACVCVCREKEREQATRYTYTWANWSQRVGHNLNWF